MAASRRRHPFLCLQFTQDSFIGSPKHHAAQDIREGGQAPGDGVGQQAQHHEEHGDAQQEQAVGTAALDKPREQGTDQAEPTQRLQEYVGHTSRSATTAARTEQARAKGNAAIFKIMRVAKTS